MLGIILINSLFILFPLLCYIIYEICMENTSVRKKEFYLDFSLISSCYLIMQYGYSYSEMLPNLMFNIPFIFACLFNRNVSIFVLSIIGIVYYVVYDFNIHVILIEYIIYYLLYILKLKNKKFEFLYIRLFVFTNTTISFWWLISNKSVFLQLSWQLIIICLFYYFLIYLIINLLNKSENITTIYNSLKDLENVKNLHESIFKITHEIKNPIAVCKGYLDMYDQNNKEHSDKYIPIIKDEINRTLILLQDFLSLNKITIEKDVLDINLLIEDVIDNFRLLLREKNIKLKYIENEDEIFIDADYNRLIQVFINIIKNSIESIEKNGEISIEIKDLENMVEIIIVDNGNGIDEENLNKLKQPFFTTKQNGTGLGVALSNEIIQAHGGNLEYISKVGKGTTTIVTLNKI